MKYWRRENGDRGAELKSFKFISADPDSKIYSIELLRSGSGGGLFVAYLGFRISDSATVRRYGAEICSGLRSILNDAKIIRTAGADGPRQLFMRVTEGEAAVGLVFATLSAFNNKELSDESSERTDEMGEIRDYAKRFLAGESLETDSSEENAAAAAASPAM